MTHYIQRGGAMSLGSLPEISTNKLHMQSHWPDGLTLILQNLMTSAGSVYNTLQRLHSIYDYTVTKGICLVMKRMKKKQTTKMKRKQAVEKLCASFPDWLPIPEDSVRLTASWQGQQQ
ncbi:hypothetical protein QQF64_008553 [Cirrhinus molitorella]|uniref:Uncharacterized protein n=1 Tax=Cirrhinus molitorella TaxID=172907 RepID=A0ABR3M8Z2_9TELE